MQTYKISILGKSGRVEHKVWHAETMSSAMLSAWQAWGIENVIKVRLVRVWE
jgi:hypothetical protein